MENKLIESVVETRDHCFICLIELEPGSSGESTSPSTVYSLDDLSRYLKVDRRKVFKANAPIPPHLFAKVEQSILKVELCNSCASINEKFTKLLASKQPEMNSERVNLNVTVYLSIIHEKLTKAKDTGLLEKFRQFIALIDSLESSRNWLGKLEMVEGLREDTMEKCFQKLQPFFPRVQIKNLTMEEVTAEQNKLRKSVLIRPTAATQSIYIPVNNSSNETYPFRIEIVELESKCHVCFKIFPTLSLLCEHFKVVHSKMSDTDCNRCGLVFPALRELSSHFTTSHRPRRKYRCNKCGIVFNQKVSLTRHQRRAANCKMVELKHVDAMRQPMKPFSMEELTKEVKSEPKPDTDANHRPPSEIIDEVDDTTVIDIGEVKVEQIGVNSELEYGESCGSGSEDEQQSEDPESQPVLEVIRSKPPHLNIAGQDTLEIADVDMDNSELSPPPQETKRMVTRKKVMEAKSIQATTKLVVGPGTYHKFIKVIRPPRASSPTSSSDEEEGDKPHDPNFRYQCTLCRNDYPTSAKCQRHLFYKHREKPKSSLEGKMPQIQCLLCQTLYVGSKRLRRHLREDHLHSEIHNCGHCREDFPSSNQLYNHLTTIHNNQIQKYFCQACGNGFLQKRYLAIHQRRANCGQINTRKVLEPLPKRPPKKHICHCEHCGEGFTKKCNLYKHIRAVHLQVRRYECEQCRKRFKTGTHLKNHAKTVHMKIRDLGCDICGKKFGRVSHLSLHRRRVHGKK